MQGRHSVWHDGVDTAPTPLGVNQKLGPIQYYRRPALSKAKGCLAGWMEQLWGLGRLRDQMSYHEQGAKVVTPFRQGLVHAHTSFPPQP